MVTAEAGNQLTYTINFTVEPDAVEPNALAGISIYPNPVRDMLTVTNVGNAIISVYELNGTLLTKVNNPDRDLQLDVSDLGAGVYILKVQMTEGISIYRFIKE